MHLPVLVLTELGGERIVLNSGKELTMSMMCSLAACKAQEGLCGHEKVMFGAAFLAAVGLSVYFMLG